MSSQVKHGDYSDLAKHYHNRAGYCPLVLKAILALHEKPVESLNIADVGAGTGKLTKQLGQLGVASVTAVEPNDAMRAEGEKYTRDLNIHWLKGKGESTTLPNESVDWVLMGSSFHWVNLESGLTEFHRILKPGGMFTALWNPRDLAHSPLETKLDATIKEIVPELTRISSGGAKSTPDWSKLLESTGQFTNVLFMEGKHCEEMSPERYLGVWHSVNDVQVQAGPERWQQILEAIKSEIAGLSVITVPYLTRAWTVWRTSR